MNRFAVARICAVLLASGLAAAGCSTIEKADQLVTLKSPPSTSPYVRHPSADCREWRALMSRRRIKEDKWKYGCATTAGLVVSVANKRDLRGGRPLAPSDAWEAVKVNTDDRAGKLEPGQVDTSKSSTTSSSK